MNKLKILFLCTGNSCRSQMAEGWARHLHGDKFLFFSAGIQAHGLNPQAVRVMKEEGVDISNHTSKTVDELSGEEFDIVFTLCGHARETCPVFPGKGKVIHHGFDDPPELAKSAATEQEALFHYQRVCREIKNFIFSLDQDYA